MQFINYVYSTRAHIDAWISKVQNEVNFNVTRGRFHITKLKITQQYLHTLAWINYK